MDDERDNDAPAPPGPADDHGPADERGRPVTALALMSGGLDSRLAAALMLEQCVHVIALNFDSVFCHALQPGTRSEAEKACDALGIELVRVPFSDKLIPLVKDPPHGHGKRMNPCIDCRIAQFRVARRTMEARGAHFFFTGEVIGQRPMSQRLQAMRLIEREAGVEGIVLRPLSAKLLPPTIPEEKGWVDRARLQAITGRSRRPQIELAKRLGITDYPASAGGCLLTDEDFACKVYELIAHSPEANERDFELLRLGRHHRLPSGAKAIVGRNETENDRLETIGRAGEFLLERDDTVGPTVLLYEPRGEEDKNLAAQLCVAYSKRGRSAAGAVRYRTAGGTRAANGTQREEVVQVEVPDKARLEAMRI